MRVNDIVVEALRFRDNPYMEGELNALPMIEASSLELLNSQYIRYADTTSQSRLRYDLVDNVIYLLLELNHIPRRSMSFSTKNIHPC